MTERPSRKERLAQGKALRERVPRSSHGEYVPSARRADPVAILEQQARSRVAALIPVRHARMLESPFAFLRGAAAIMAADLAGTPSTGLITVVCGDAHVANFGICGTVERQMVFSINDFDESCKGPWEWDLKRLATSAVVATRYFGGGQAVQEAAVRSVVSRYREHMREYAELGFLQTWYSMIHAEDAMRVLSPAAQARAAEMLANAQRRNNKQVLKKLTRLVDGQLRIVEEPPLIVRESRIAEGQPLLPAAAALFADYVASLSSERRLLLGRYRIVDIARKVVGVGSVGTRCWVVLLIGADMQDPLFIQVKEAQQSVVAAHYLVPSRMPHQGQRVVTCQRLIQGSPDLFLGWGSIGGRHFYMRQLRDLKGGAEFVHDPSRLGNFVEYCGVCGWALALAHAKAGDAAMISGYMGNGEAMDEAIVRFAQLYAAQNQRDFEAMRKAAKAGRIPVAKSGYS